MKITCPHCGFTFKSRLLDARGAAGVTMFGNSEQCPNPKCRKMVYGPSGTFDFDEQGEIIRILSGPEFTADVLGRLIALTGKAQAEKYAIDQFEEEIARDIPQANKILEFFRRHPEAFIALLALLYTIAKDLLSSNQGQGTTVNNYKTVNNYYNVTTDLVASQRKDSVGYKIQSTAELPKAFKPKQVKQTNKKSRITKKAQHLISNKTLAR